MAAETIAAGLGLTGNEALKAEAYGLYIGSREHYWNMPGI